MNDKATLVEHAEAWWTEQGKTVPNQNSTTWQIKYRQWINFAFAGFYGGGQCESENHN